MSDRLEQTKMLYGEHPRVMEVIAEVKHLRSSNMVKEIAIDEYAKKITALKAENAELKEKVEELEWKIKKFIYDEAGGSHENP